MRTVVVRAAGVLLLGAGLVALVAPLRGLVDHDRRVVAVAALGWVALAACARRVPLSLTGVAGLGRWGPLVVGVISAGVGLATCYHVTWDAGVVETMAESTSRGRPLSAYQLGYLSRFPNNTALFAMERGLGWLGSPGQAGIAALFVLVNAVAVGSCAWLAHHAVANVGGRRSAVAAQVVVLVLVGLSPWVSVPYTDVVTTVVALLPAWLLTRRGALWPQTWPQALGAGLVLAVVGVGIAVKATIWVVAASVALTALISRAQSPRRLLTQALPAAAVVVLLSAGAAAATTRVAGAIAVPRGQAVTAGRSWTPLMYVNMGLRVQHIGGIDRYGTYNGPIVRDTRGMTSEEMNRYARARLADLLGRLGPAGVAAFEVRAYLWNWGDGTFWAYGEGADARAAPRFDLPIGSFVRSWNQPSGRWWALRADVTQGLWIVLLIGGGWCLVRCRTQNAILYPALTILGAAAFINLFDGRSRYVLSFVPLVVTACLMAWCLRPGPPRAASRSSVPDRDASSGATTPRPLLPTSAADKRGTADATAL